MDIDLGKDTVFNVKIGADLHVLREPSVREIKAMNDSFKDGVSEVDGFISLLAKLGLPEDISGSLGVNKMTKLINGIMGDGAEKK